MLIGIGIIVIGALLFLWGIRNFGRTRGKGGTFLDLLINGWSSGLGQIIVSLVFIAIGIIVILEK